MLTPVFFWSNRYHCLQGKKKKLNLSYSLWGGFLSLSHQCRAKVNPWYFLIVHIYCSETFVQSKVLSWDKYLLNLKLVKLFSPLYSIFTNPLPYIYFQMPPFYTKSDQLLAVELPLAARLWAWGAFLPKHKHTSTSSNHRAVTSASMVLKIRGHRRAQKKKDVQKSNILPQLSILCKMLVLQNCIFNCCYIN